MTDLNLNFDTGIKSVTMGPTNNDNISVSNQNNTSQPSSQQNSPQPPPDNTQNTMYYMTTKELITGLEDLSSRGIDGAADVMRRAIATAESIDPEREALFIIEDKKGLKLFHFKREEMIKLTKD